MNLCACVGIIGTDQHCPCKMTALGLIPTPLWTEENKEELRSILDKFKEKEIDNTNRLL